MAMKSDPSYLIELIGGEVNLVLGTLRDRGGKRFGRAFGIAGFLVFAAYVGVYVPPQQKSSRLQAQIDKAKALSDYGEKYKAIRDLLNSAYSGLPVVDDREQWLSNSLRDSLSASGINVEEFKPIREQESNGLIAQTSEVSLALTFTELFDWILRVESAKPMLHVQLIEVVKKKEKPGMVEVRAEISTLIPNKRFR